MKKICGFYECKDRAQWYIIYGYTWQEDLNQRYSMTVCGTHAIRNDSWPKFWTDAYVLHGRVE